jgi:hypothetical protein
MHLQRPCSDGGGARLQRGGALRAERLEALGAAKPQRVADGARPEDLAHREHDLARPVEQPRLALLCHVVLDRGRGDRAQARHHDALDVEQPRLDAVALSRGVDCAIVRERLALDRCAARDLEIRLERQACHRLEALLDEGLDVERVLGFGEDFQDLVVGEEEEARERELLRVEVCVERLLDRRECLHRGARSSCLCLLALPPCYPPRGTSATRIAIASVHASVHAAAPGASGASKPPQCYVM